MNEFPPLEHALFASRSAGGFERLARSPGFADEWTPEAERLCSGFGERPEGVACPGAVFAQPFGENLVAVVQVIDQGEPAELAFHLVIVPAEIYRLLGGDPFHVAEHCPPPWTARGELTPLPCPAPQPMQRPIAAVRKVIQSPDSAALLGGAQLLLDGGRVVFRRPAPDLALVRGLWTLLPDSTRKELWPASFAFGNALGFHVLVVPHIDPASVPRYLSEDGAADYPEGHYERTLQTAAEHGDQETLDKLFGRRSYREIRNLGIVLLIVMLFIPMLFRLLGDGTEKKDRKSKDEPAFELPDPDKFPALDDQTRDELTADLRALALDIHAVPALRPVEVTTLFGMGAVGLPFAVFDPGLTPIESADAERLLHDIDVKLGAPDQHRKGGPLRNLGPIERQLRGLVWKHAIDEYNDMGVNPRELVKKLRDKVAMEPEGGR